MPPALNLRAGRALDVLSFILSDVRYGLGAYLGVYLLTEHNWDAAAIGAVFFISGLAGVVSQTPLGAMVDAMRAKRALLAGAVAVATGAALMVPLLPHFLPVAIAGVAGALAGGIVGPASPISTACAGASTFATIATIAASPTGSTSASC